MIKFERTEVMNWENAIRGMRNPLNSWEKSDSEYCDLIWACGECSEIHSDHHICPRKNETDPQETYVIGPNDYGLMVRLRNAGSDHRKFMRMIIVSADIIAPLYWWKEFDTYKIGTVANSCSTMHTIHKKKFELSDFSTDRLLPHPSLEVFERTIDALNMTREAYLACEDPVIKKDWWYNMIQLLPSSYNQMRTVLLNYEVLSNIYHSRKDHKLDEWRVGFIDWIRSLPYSEIITGLHT